MRFYALGNFYLSSIQQGIQGAHSISDMAVKYYPSPERDSTNADNMYWEWAEEHKTIVLLNGGVSQDLEEWDSFMDGSLDIPDVPRLNEEYDGYSPYPFVLFREEGIDDAASSFGVVLPEKIYEGVKIMNKVTRLQRDAYDRRNWEMNNTLQFDRERDEVYTNFEIELMTRLNRCKLAI